MLSIKTGTEAQQAWKLKGTHSGHYDKAPLKSFSRGGLMPHSFYSVAQWPGTSREEGMDHKAPVVPFIEENLKDARASSYATAWVSHNQ